MRASPCALVAVPVGADLDLEHDRTRRSNDQGERVSVTVRVDDQRFRRLSGLLVSQTNSAMQSGSRFVHESLELVKLQILRAVEHGLHCVV